MQPPHPDRHPLSIAVAVVTVSDTRSPETDQSGQLLQETLTAAGHRIGFYAIVRDEPPQIEAHLQALGNQPDVDVIIFNGGTGIAPRDTTYDAIERLLEKQLPGFGEVFRWLSYQEIGSRAIASRATAGVYQSKLVISLPGSQNAVRLALDKLILPELSHLVTQLKG
ncbi:MAG: molybdenum cofactor biosynthesis protein MoaB [Leptolyngbyaceae cyanobacterium SL_7_1]|nr:molybdenum cofactor biosynthesis protein MoaB [Leptolyngbyaceae cyanobacterium SL_7_1]